MKLPSLISKFRLKRSKKTPRQPEVVDVQFSDTVHSLIVNRALRNRTKRMQLTDPEMVEFIEQVIYGLQQPLDFKMKKQVRRQVAEEILYKVSKKKIV